MRRMTSFHLPAFALILLLSAGTVRAQAAQPNPKDRLAELLNTIDAADDAKRWQAVMQLADLGPAARPALPRLIELLHGQNEDLRLAACLALGRMGKDAVPSLIKLLDTKDARIRYYACWALGANGSAAKDAVPALLLQIRRPHDSDVFRRAAIALGQIGHDPDRVVPALLETLKEIADHRESGVLDGVASFGPLAVPHLVKPLERSDHSQSMYASMIAGRIGAPARDLLPQLEKLLALTQAGEEALQAMTAIGPAAAPFLKKHLNRGTVEWRLRVVDSLAQVGAWEDVVDAVDAEAVDLRRRAVHHLDASGGSQPAVLAGLIHALKNRDPGVAVAAHIALGRRGAEARKAIPALVEAMFGANPMEHARSLETLRALQHDALPEIRAQMKSADKRRRALAGFWLATRLNETGEAPIATMRDGIDSLQGDELREIAKALAFRRVNDKVVPILAGFLKTEVDTEERFRILQALCPLAEVDDNAIRVIAMVLRDSDAILRGDAARFLGGLAPRSQIELPALRKALEDSNGTVRERARAAIALIEAKKR